MQQDSGERLQECTRTQAEFLLWKHLCKKIVQHLTSWTIIHNRMLKTETTRSLIQQISIKLWAFYGDTAHT